MMSNMMSENAKFIWSFRTFPLVTLYMFITILEDHPPNVNYAIPLTKLLRILQIQGVIGYLLVLVVFTKRFNFAFQHRW